MAGNREGLRSRERVQCETNLIDEQRSFYLLSLGTKGVFLESINFRRQLLQTCFEAINATRGTNFPASFYKFQGAKLVLRRRDHYSGTNSKVY